MGGLLLHAAARGGVIVEDFLYLLEDDGPAGARPGTLRVLRPTVGGELGVESGPWWVVAGATARPFQPERTATGLTVDLAASYEVIPKLTVDLGVAWARREAPVRATGTDRVHGVVSDDQLFARVGLGVVLGSGPDGSEPARLQITVQRDGSPVDDVPVEISDGRESWTVVTTTGGLAAIALPPGTYDLRARHAGADASAEVGFRGRDLPVTLDLQRRPVGSVSVSVRHAEDGPLDRVVMLLRGDDGFVLSDAMGPWGLSDLDIPHGRYRLLLWSTDGAIYTEAVEVLPRRPLHIAATLGASRVRMDDQRIRTDEPIAFDADERLPDTSRALLDEVAAVLHANPALRKVEVQSHIDTSVGDEDERITQARAERVRAYLIDLGIDPERLTAVGYGHRFPTATNRTDEGRAKNRRVVFLVLEEAAE